MFCSSNVTSFSWACLGSIDSSKAVLSMWACRLFCILSSFCPLLCIWMATFLLHWFQPNKLTTSNSQSPPPCSPILALFRTIYCPVIFLEFWCITFLQLAVITQDLSVTVQGNFSLFLLCLLLNDLVNDTLSHLLSMVRRSNNSSTGPFPCKRVSGTKSRPHVPQYIYAAKTVLLHAHGVLVQKSEHQLCYLLKWILALGNSALSLKIIRLIHNIWWP